MQHIERDGIDFVVVGGGGYTNVHKIITNGHKYAEATHGFLIVRANANSMQFKMIGVRGKHSYSPW